MLRRRTLLKAAGGAGLGSLLASLAQPRQAHAGGLFGDLVSDPEGILDLPPGFSYRILERWLDPMNDGLVVPNLPDGMACFAGPDNTLILMRNHELSTTDGPYPIQLAPPEAYDKTTMGCVTRVVLDATTFERISSNLVLCGTAKNCAGGPSPWGWLTCEEITVAGHGYVFACDTAATSVQPPQKIPAYGRCRHEAACVDPARNIAYLTEDQHDSALYRFVPDDPAEPWKGRLQALRVVGLDAYPMSMMPQGSVLPIDWVDVEDPEPQGDTLRLEARSKGAAIFDRGEGITFAAGEVYAIATSGGPIGKGQIFRIIDHPDTPTIEALLVVTDATLVDQPDNITVAPWGDLYFGEDGGNGNFIRGITGSGQVFDFAFNALTSGEFSGVCFSPDGRALFCNLWGSGLTFVITGPFPGAAHDGDSADATTTDASTSSAEPTTDADNTTHAPELPTGELPANSSSETGDPLEVGGAFEELSCACRSDADSPGAAAVLVVTTALAVAAPDRRCDMQPPPTQD